MTPAIDFSKCNNNIISRYQREVNMSRRVKMKPKKDHRIYTQTANKVKKINVKPKLSRGGIRL